MIIKPLLLSILFIIFINPIFAVVNVYGPSVSHEAMKAAAKDFTAKTRIPVVVISGPQSIWQNAALAKASVIYALSDVSLERLLKDRPARFDATSVNTLAHMDAVLIVRKNNPKNIKGIDTLTDNENLPLLISHTSGYARDFHQSTWERLTIITEANTSKAMERFRSDITIPVWMAWADVLTNNPELGDQVPVEPRYRITRVLSILVAKDADEDTKAFVEFLNSPEGQEHFTKYGWYFP